jgi:hypothetical protein
VLKVLKVPFKGLKVFRARRDLKVIKVLKVQLKERKVFREL